MKTSSFEFTAFSETELFSDHPAIGSTFAQPAAPTLGFAVADDDAYLSGDFFDHALDARGQTASITADGTDLGNGHQIYAERKLLLHGDDGQAYVLVEIGQEGSDTSFYTYLGTPPAAGVTLSVTKIANTSGVPYGELGAGEMPQNIVDIAAGSDDFNILVKALGAAGLVETVRDLGDITVFAPTDAAFAQLAVDLGFDGDTNDEDAVFGAIVAALTELGGGDPIPLLTDVLLYHVSAGAKTVEEIDALGSVATLLADASFKSENGELVDNEPDVANPSVVIPDIQADNGTIQAIDRVLLPIDIPGNEAPLPTIAGLVAASGGAFDADGTDFDLLLNAAQAAGLVDALNDANAELTVFAPNDDAFIHFVQNLGFDGSEEDAAFEYMVNAATLLSKGGDPIPLLSEILQYHVAPGALSSGEVLNAEQIVTLQGSTLSVNGITLQDADPDIADPSIVATDLQASNGIVHVLNGVLLPIDVLNGDGGWGAVDFEIGSDGKDRFSTGANTDFVSGLGGNDGMWLGRGDDVGLGGDGNDRLNGSDGNDVLDGGNGRDLLIGGRDHDTLTGGADADIFLFKTHDGMDTITDFAAGEDVIKLKGFGLHDYEQLEHYIHDTSDGAVIDLGNTEITLAGVHTDELDQDDFWIC